MSYCLTYKKNNLQIHFLFIKKFLSIVALLTVHFANAQNNIVTYAGNTGKETFYDVMEISNGTFLICGYADNLNWIAPNVPKTSISYAGNIPNALGKNRYGFILQLSSHMDSILHVVHFPQGAVEDIRFMKTNSQPYKTTGDLFISCNTSDTDPNNGGYIIAKLNSNFINAIPNTLSWYQVVWAKSYAKTYHPWDVTSKGQVYYVSGEAHAYDWSAMYCLNSNGKRKVINNWRTHWLNNGSEWKGTPASANPQGGIDSVNYSGIALKITGRCELRSWTPADFNLTSSDGNGGTRKGKWPADFLFNSPCDPQNPTANSPGYNLYSPEACCPVWGASSICVDRRNDDVYLGMNFKSYYNPANSPDFEPAVIAFDSTGGIKWWSRLYHEITPAGDTVGSLPDQYVDAMAIDYQGNKLTVAARAHGNNTENLWQGNKVNYSPNAYGFQNQFTGTNGNIHESWMGKLRLADGVLTNATYVAELAEGTGGLGTAHSDPNLDGWPDPNTGWPDVNTTYITKNNLKISSNGDVCMLGVGRRTITTKNAYQKMVKPYWGGKSCWNSFVRMYDKEFHVPKYSSLVVGQWDTLSQAGGDNTELFGLYKTSKGIVAVGRHKADNADMPVGNTVPINAVPAWGVALPNNESALLVYYVSDSLSNVNDQISTGIEPISRNPFDVKFFPNPAKEKIHFSFSNEKYRNETFRYTLFNPVGQRLSSGTIENNTIPLNSLTTGVYFIELIWSPNNKVLKKIVVE
jgi:hypothetical protein